MTDDRSLAEMAADDPELMRSWGEINNAWDDIERLLYRAFDAMLIDTDSFATQAIFYSQRSHAARRAMVEELAKCALIGKPETHKKLKNAINRVRGRSEDRHNLTHGTWGITADLKSGTQELGRIPLQADAMKPKPAYSRGKLKRVRDEMRDTTRALKEAIEPLEDEKRAELLNIQNRRMSRLTHGAVNLDQS